jgi:hypothetical protein
MLKSALPNAGLWISPNTGHGINLEEPAAFNAQIENFLSAVKCSSWRRGDPASETRHVLPLQGRASTAGAYPRVNHERTEAELLRLDRK